MASTFAFSLYLFGCRHEGTGAILDVVEGRNEDHERCSVPGIYSDAWDRGLKASEYRRNLKSCVKRYGGGVPGLRGSHYHFLVPSINHGLTFSLLGLRWVRWVRWVNGRDGIIWNFLCC